MEEGLVASICMFLFLPLLSILSLNPLPFGRPEVGGTPLPCGRDASLPIPFKRPSEDVIHTYTHAHKLTHTTEYY